MARRSANSSHYNLPPRPPLCGTEHSSSVPLQVFGYAWTIEEYMQWADKNKVSPRSTIFNRLCDSVHQIARQMPRHELRLTTVHALGGETDAMVLGTNETKASIDQAYDVANIKHFKKVLRTTKLPQWYEAM